MEGTDCFLKNSEIRVNCSCSLRVTYTWRHGTDILSPKCNVARAQVDSGGQQTLCDRTGSYVADCTYQPHSGTW